MLRAAKNNPNIEIVAVNDPFIGTDYMQYMFKVSAAPPPLSPLPLPCVPP